MPEILTELEGIVKRTQDLFDALAAQTRQLEIDRAEQISHNSLLTQRKKDLDNLEVNLQQQKMEIAKEREYIHQQRFLNEGKEKELIRKQTFAEERIKTFETRKEEIAALERGLQTKIALGQEIDRKLEELEHRELLIKKEIAIDRERKEMLTIREQKITQTEQRLAKFQ